MEKHVDKVPFVPPIDLSSRQFSEKTTTQDVWKRLETESAQNEIDYLSSDEVNSRFYDIESPRESAIAINGRYLHANNVVKEEESAIHFVAGQAPTKAEEILFWQAIFENGYSIMDLTTLSDQSPAPGCVTKYYPDLDHQIKKFGQLTVQLKKKEGHLCEYQVTDGAGITKTIKRYHYTEWKDYRTVTVDHLKDLVNVLNTEMGNKLWTHCRAGVGRTGTLIAAYLLFELINNHHVSQETLDDTLFNIIIKLRSRRGYQCVQQETQLDLLREFGKSLL